MPQSPLTKLRLSLIEFGHLLTLFIIQAILEIFFWHCIAIFRFNPFLTSEACSRNNVCGVIRKESKGPLVRPDKMQTLFACYRYRADIFTFRLSENFFSGVMTDVKIEPTGAAA